MTKKYRKKTLLLTFVVVLVISLLGAIGCKPLKPGGDLREANLSGRNLAGVDLSGADLSNANLSNADLFRADLSKANLSNADLSNADLSNADLLMADLSEANLTGANLYGARLRGTDLTGATLSGLPHYSIGVAEAVFKNADLSGADLSGFDLPKVDLEGARLVGANLRGSTLRGANLSSADLSSADLSQADLRNAILAGADLSEANLYGANLEGVIGLPDGVLSKAISQNAVLGKTVMFDLLSEACRGRPISEAGEMEGVSNMDNFILLNGNGTDYYDRFERRGIASTGLGYIRFVACIEEPATTLRTCDYIGMGEQKIERYDAQVKIVDLRTGEEIANELIRGEDPERRTCPGSICIEIGGSGGCAGRTTISHLRGKVPKEQINEFVKMSLAAFEAEAHE